MKNSLLKFAVACFALVLTQTLTAGNYRYIVKTDKPDAIYSKGETIRFSAQLLEDKKPAKGYKVTYKLTGTDGLKKEGEFTSGDKPYEITASLNCPGWVYVELTAYGKDGKPLKTYRRGRNGKLSGEIGAMVAPFEIAPVAAKEPADFDEFWKSCRAQLAKVPIKAKLTKIEVPAKYKGVEVYDVAVDCAGEMPVTGYLLKPVKAAAKSLPAIVRFRSAVVTSAQKPFDFADKKVIAFDVNPYGIPNGKDKSFYLKLKRTSLRGYQHRNKDNRDKFYFHDMFLRVMRALEYVKSLPEWDGKNLIIIGGSMGGGQSIAASALDPDVSFAIINIPALCDFAGVFAKPERQQGWPRPIKASDDPKVAKAVAYYDGVNFAKRIKCPVYVCTGFIDNVCVPTSVFAFYNNLPKSTPKVMTTCPYTGHYNQTRNTKGNARLDKFFKSNK